MRATLRRAVVPALLAVAAALPHTAGADDWAKFATISSTQGTNKNRLCLGEGSRAGDIGCPTYAPSVTTAGDVSISGNVSANKFIGDGSGLTGLSLASGDRIVSGTSPFTQMMAISDTRYISITQGGSNTGWFDPTRGLVTLGVSATGPISGTNGYFSGHMKIGGTVSTSDAIQVGQSSLNCAIQISGSVRYNTTSDTLQVCTGNGWKSLVSGTAGAGTLTGTGSATAVAFWSSSSALSYDSGLYWDNTNKRLGIGAPISGAGPPIDISMSSSYSAIRVRNSDATGYASMSMLDASGGQAGFVGYAGLNSGIFPGTFWVGSRSPTIPMVFTTGNDAERMRITGSGNVGISKSNPVAKLDVMGTISASDAIQVGHSNLACSSGISGSIRYSAISSTLEYCNSSAWVSLVASTGIPSFSVNRGSSNQTVTANTWTTLDWTQEVFDTDNGFDLSTDRYTPSVPGKYLFVLNGACSGASVCGIGILKNGASAAINIDSDAFLTTSVILEMNGVTDYVTAQGNNPAGTSIGESSIRGLNFSGTLLASGGSGGGPAGSTGDIQFNSGGAFAADIGQLTWDVTNKRLGIGVSSPQYGVQASGGIAANYLGFNNSTTYGSSLCRSGVDGNGYYLVGLCTSLSSYKRNIEDLKAPGLETLMLLKPREFDWAPGHGEGHDGGFIAEELVKVYPLGGQYDGGKLTGVKYDKLTALLTKGVQELKVLSDTREVALRAELAVSNNNIEILRKEIERLRKVLEGREGAGQLQ